MLTETYQPIVGGGETQARLLAESLLSRGSSVTIVTRRVDRRHPRRETVGGIEILRLPPTGTRHLLKWGLLPTALPVLLRRRRRDDVLLVSGFRILGIPALLAARLTGIPCVLKADSLGEMSGEFFTAGLARWGLKTSSLAVRPFLAWRRSLLRRADAFVAISSAVRDELVQHGVTSTRIHLIPNSVDTARFRPLPPGQRGPLRRRLGIPFERRVVTYTGRLVSYKGLPLLLEVWREIRRSHPRAGLVLVGSGGLDMHNCEDELRQFVARHGLEGSVYFTGAVDNVHQFLQTSDIFVLPTEQEAFGISLIEAMACGLPVVSTAVGGVRDIVEDGVDGVLVGRGDRGQLSGALEMLLGDEALCRRLGAAGRRAAEERYSSTTISERYLGLLKGAMAGTG